MLWDWPLNCRWECFLGHCPWGWPRRFIVWASTALTKPRWVDGYPAAREKVRSVWTEKEELTDAMQMSSAWLSGVNLAWRPMLRASCSRSSISALAAVHLVPRLARISLADISSGLMSAGKGVERVDASLRSVAALLMLGTSVNESVSKGGVPLGDGGGDNSISSQRKAMVKGHATGREVQGDHQDSAKFGELLVDASIVARPHCITWGTHASPTWAFEKDPSKIPTGSRKRCKQSQAKCHLLGAPPMKEVRWN